MSLFDRVHRSIATMGGAISYHFPEIDGDFGRKSQNNPIRCVFGAPAEGVPLEIGYRRWGSNRVKVLPGRQRILTISSAVWIQCTNVTDRQTDTGRQQRSRLRIASRGKNLCFLIVNWFYSTNIF